MADPRTIKKNLLQDLMQRARSSTHSASPGGVKFLGTQNLSLKGSRSSLRSPKIKSSSRSGSKRLHFPSVFRSSKQTSSSPVASKSDSLKENSKRGGGKNKRPKSFYEEEKKSSPLISKNSTNLKTKEETELAKIRDKTLAEKVLQSVKQKHTPSKTKTASKSQHSTPQHVLYTTFEDNSLKSLLQDNESITVVPWKTSKGIPASPGRSITKVSYCNSCGHVDEKNETKLTTDKTIVVEKREKIQEENTSSKQTNNKVNRLSFKANKSKAKNNTKTGQRPKSSDSLEPQKRAVLSPQTFKRRPLFRSFSDPSASPRKDTKPRVLYQQKQQVKQATITQTQSFYRIGIRRRHTDSDLDNSNSLADKEIALWNDQIKNSASVFADSSIPAPKSSDSHLSTSAKNMMPKVKNGGVGDIYPLLKTKIPEEYTQEDGSVTYRKGVAEGVQKIEADRDSGVDVDNKALCQNNSTDENEDYDIDNETMTTPDSALESSSVQDDSEFDFSTLKRPTKHATMPKLSSTNQEKDENIKEEDDEGDSDTLKKGFTISIRDNGKWDMYALLRRFESVEWELSPAENMKRQTLDLDNCNLDCVPAAVTEIEYYAFRDVEAVSLNHNSKIENADVLGKLADLRIINMWGCNLKAIPQTWSRLSKLQMLGLGNNKELSSFGPLKHLTNIIWLDLGGCNLKKIPDVVLNMMKLKVLALGGNPGIEIGDEICSLWDLKKLGLNDCELEEIPKSVFSLIKLTHLHLDNNYICQINQEIVQLTDLEELTVTGNPGITFPKLLSQCDTIRCIIVDSGKDLSRVSGTLKSRMRQMPTATSPVKEPAPKPRNMSYS
uniref:probable serine/threonine-protein kinase drkD n=1 Tax=Styela clava TaxID=7725 RepID=UPI00193ABFA8|nr:probable serine/threonine-protein kinase drkD [Styela clava]